MSSADDQLVADYLSRLATSAASLPADRREELIEEISLHITEARAVLAATDTASEAAVPTAVAGMLEQLGRPEDIARAAAEHSETDRGVFAHDQPAGSPPGGQMPGSYRPAAPGLPAPGRRALDIGTVILLLIGGFLIGLGWIVGVVMLWASPRWRTSDKLLGTLVWPGGLAALLAVPRFGTGLPPLLVLSLLLIGLGGPILVAIRLLRQARRAPAQPPAEPAALQPV